MTAVHDPDAAAAEMRTAGVEPLVRYPGSNRPWPCRCMTCGTHVAPRLYHVRTGVNACKVCGARRAALARQLPEHEAVRRMIEAGYVPLGPYPGHSGDPWPALHLGCGRLATPNLQKARKGVDSCRMCTFRGFGATPRLTAEAAESLMAAADFHPLTPFPGPYRPWPAVHTACGTETALTVAQVRHREGCLRCAVADATGMIASARLYVVTSPLLRMCALGITIDGTRLRRVVADGWQFLCEVPQETARQAVDLKTRLLRDLHSRAGSLPHPAVGRATGSGPHVWEQVPHADTSPAVLAALVVEGARTAPALPGTLTHLDAYRRRHGAPATDP